MVTLVTAICGAVFGFAALMLNFAAFLRDRARLKVALVWDQKISGSSPNLTYDPNKLYGVVSITNTGRRPVYVASITVVLPNRTEPIQAQSFTPPKLGEGDPPALYLVDPEKLGSYKENWQTVRAFVRDSTGRVYKSPKVKQAPSWATRRT